MSEEKKVFETPQIFLNSQGWGPPSTCLPEQFVHLPYAPFGKDDKLGRAADFAAPLYYQQNKFSKARRQMTMNEDRANEEFQYKFDAIEDSLFELVDTAKTTKKKYGPVRRQWQPNNRGRGRGGRGGRAGQYGGQRGSGRGGDNYDNRRFAGQRGGGRGGYGQRGGNRNYNRNRQDQQASVRVQADWQVMEEFDLSQLTKLQTNLPEVTDLLWCGQLKAYDENFDRTTVKTGIRLLRAEHKEFYYVTTTDDPVIEDLAVKKAGNVFATDTILAHLMACTRSVAPWDLVVQKLGDTIFIDKRDDSFFDFLTVNETAAEPPVQGEDAESINTPRKLAIEATMINQNLSQQVLREDVPAKEFDRPNPFFNAAESTPGMAPATFAYRYRKFKLGDNINLIARCELHGTVNKRGTEQFMTTYALNEWDSKLSGGVEWRQKIDTQRGAVLATELKNNSAKLARWTAQAILAGADQMKIGYVSRVTRNNAYAHIILGTQFFKPRDFAAQITLNVNNMWGIIKMLVDMFQGLENGKYVIMQDPNKAVVRVYSVPPDTFESEEEEENEEGKEDEDDA